MSFQLLVFDTRRGNSEGEEDDKVLGFFPESTSLNERISLAGLLQGLHIFSGSLERPQVSTAESRLLQSEQETKQNIQSVCSPLLQVRDKSEIIETDSSIWSTFEAEDGIFLTFTAAKTWLPRHVSQENLLGFLMHIHQLMKALFCGVQYMLDKVRK